MARPERLPSEKELKYLKELKAKGKTDQECYKALGVCRTTFGKWKKLSVESEDGVTIGDKIKEAAVKGREDRMKRHLDLAVDALDTLLTVQTNTNTKVKKKRIKQEDGSYKMVVVETLEETKITMPNPMLVIFTLVNRDPDNWQSINRTEVANDTNDMPEGADIIVEDAGEFEE